MTMPMSSRRSFMSTAAVAAAASGCAVRAPAAAAICRAAPYLPTVDAPPLAVAAVACASPVAAPAEAAADSDATLLELCDKFRRIHRANEEAWQRYCATSKDDIKATKALEEEFDAQYDEWAAASDACYATPPTTPAGALALLDVLLARDAEHIEPTALAPLRNVRAALAATVQS